MNDVNSIHHLVFFVPAQTVTEFEWRLFGYPEDYSHDQSIEAGEHGGSVVERRTPER